MAEGSKAPSVSYRHNVARGEHEIGVSVQGYFVPFVQLPDAAFEQGLENAQNVAAAGKAAEGEEE